MTDASTGDARVDDLTNTPQYLPRELKGHIASFGTRPILASLSRVDHEFNEEAERLLYQKLYIDLRVGAHPTIHPTADILAVLLHNPHKAGLVQRLFVDFAASIDSTGGGTAPPPVRVASQLCHALVHMNALVDLRLQLPFPHYEYAQDGPDEEPYARGSYTRLFDDFFRNDARFQLRTLYVSGRLDLSSIITRQPQLELLGLYDWGDTAGSSSVVPDVLNRVSHGSTGGADLVMFSLNRAPTFSRPLSLGIYIPDGRDLSTTAVQRIMHSLSEDPGEYVDTGYISEVGFWSTELRDMTRCLQDVARRIPSVYHIRFWSQHLDVERLYSSDMLRMISAIPRLEGISLDVWRRTPPQLLNLPSAQKLQLARKWMESVKTLLTVSFHDKTKMVRDTINTTE